MNKNYFPNHPVHKLHKYYVRFKLQTYIHICTFVYNVNLNNMYTHTVHFQLNLDNS